MAEALRDFLAASTLNGGIDSSTLTIVVTDGSVFPSTGSFDIRVDDELIVIVSRSSNTLTASSRAGGTPATTAASHSSGVTVQQVLTRRSVLAVLTEASGLIGCRAKRTTNLSVANATDTVPDMDSATEYGGDFWTIGTPSRITIPTGAGGLYIVSFSVQWDSNTTGFRYAAVRKNATSDVAADRRLPVTGASQDTPVLPWAFVVLADGDYITGKLYQNSGGNLNAEYVDDWSMNLCAFRMAF